ncbi:MAG: hypothetical protein HMLKMBBP_02226 [Planctomycetes bacterium]|nr:hypothetical protein [Planctomycetota bacterium]
MSLLASDPRRGETLLETAVALDPGHEPAWHGLLAAAHSRGGLSAFRERLRRVPGTLRGVAARSFVEGAAADLAGDADDAAACYARALAASPRHVGAANNLAWILAVRNGRPRDALPHAELAASLAPRSPEALDTLGWTRFLLGEPEAAEALLARARRLAPDRATVALRHGRSLLGCGRRGEARAAFRDAARLDPRIAETGEFLEAAAKAALEIHR